MRYIGTNELVWQADTKVSTFASGLVLVQRRAIARKANAVRMRASLEVGDRLPLDNDPSIGGVYIFPEVQEQSSPGFVEFLISGYGRTTTRRREVASENASSVTIASITVPALFNSVTTTQIVEAGERFAFLAPAAPATISLAASFSTTSIASQWGLNSVSRTNYGRYDEVIAVYSAFNPSF